MSKLHDNNKTPQHIAIIMDGNGRWAKARGEERSRGHIEGVTALRRTVMAASREGVKYLTVYAFSSENWSRPTAEIDALMALLAQAIEQYTPEFMANGIRVRAIGDLKRLPLATQEAIDRTEKTTAKNSKITLIVCLSYSSRWEVNEAMRTLAQKVASGEINPKDLPEEEAIAPYLSTYGIPDPDLLIRTGGELRISNFLLYQLAYTELYFTPTLWPDFDEDDLHIAIQDFARRNRRFGNVDSTTPIQSSKTSAIAPEGVAPLDTL